MMESVEDHVVRAWLRNYVLHRDYLQEMGLVVANERRCYEIIAGGGRRRTVFVEQGEFDYVRYYDMCEMRQEGHHKSLKKWKDVGNRKSPFRLKLSFTELICSSKKPVPKDKFKKRSQIIKIS